MSKGVASWTCGELEARARLNEQRVKFNVVRQAYSTYRVENGQILKQMTAISDIRDVVDSDPPRGQATLNDVSHVISPSEIIRDNIEVTKGEPTEEDQVRELNFEVEEDIINIYETKDHIILLACPVQKIFLTNKVDEQNNPRLRYLTRVETNVVPKPHMVEQSPKGSTDKD